MIRFGKSTFALLAAALLLPVAAEAQQDTPQTRDANRALALAMTRQTPEARRPYYEEALAKALEGLQRTPDNAQVYLILGQAHAGLQNYEAADSAFRRAVEMHPAYQEEVNTERESTWIDLFQEGIEHMSAQRYDEAIRSLELANMIYDVRPEAYMNLASLYVHAGRPDDAAQAYVRVAETVDGPAFASLDEEQQTAWSSYKETARISSAQILGNQGVDAFQEERFSEAAGAFRRATEVNPHGRDYWFNLAQSLYARSSQLTAEIEDATPERTAEITAELNTVYEELATAAERFGEFDPVNENLALLLAQANRGRSLLAADTERDQWQQRTLAALQRHEDLQFTVDNIQVATNEEDQAVVTGELTNLKLAAGAPIQLRITLLSIDGVTVGSQTVTINAPEAEQTAQFRATTQVEGGEIAGWKYEIVG
jgi:tetratricopeptide (TPR) repeat protein